MLTKDQKTQSQQALEQQFVLVYDELSEKLFRHCYFRLYDREKAKEVSQETFCRAWKYIVEGKKIDNLRAFLYQIAHNLIVDTAMKKKTSSLDELSEIGFDPGVDDTKNLEEKIDGRDLIENLKKLEPDQKQVILMKYVDELTTDEIALAIGQTKNAVYVRLHRAVKQAKKIFAEPTETKPKKLL